MNSLKTYTKRGIVPLCGLIAGCSFALDREAPMAVSEVVEEKAEAEPMAFDQAAGSAAPAAPARSRLKKEKKKGASKLANVLGGLAKADKDGALEDDEVPGQPAATRSWFPETFVFEPAVITDAEGLAQLDVKVPDRLTTWRVLALAHSRQGGQAGAVSTFRSTLPVYIDPVLPPFLYVGDQVQVPVQVVNTTDAAVQANVRVSLDEDLGAKLSGGGPVRVPAGRSVLQPARIAAQRPGQMLFRAGLQGKDAVERGIPILAKGRPVRLEEAGTLGGKRSARFLVPQDLEPGATRVRLQVYPGALGLLRNELGAAVARQGLAEDAYALLLAGRAPGLLRKLGAEAAPEAFRTMALKASQRVLRHARSPNAMQAALLAEAALAHPDNPVLDRLGARLSQQVAAAQRPDGTFGGGSGWPMRRLMVATAEGVAAVRAGAQDASAQQRADVAALRASGAFERYAGRIDDPYTAAWAVVSGAAQGSLRDGFIAVVKKAVVQGESGARYVPAPKAARRADGLHPGTTECTALAALALADDEEAKAWLPDLGATLMTAYRPGRGWGDGRTNLLALRAVLQIFSKPLPKQFRLRVTKGDDVWIDWQAQPGYAEGPWSTAVLKDGLQGQVQLELTPEPPIAGMAYALSIETHVPWDEQSQTPGLELSIDVQRDARVGQPLEVTLRAGAPAGRALTIRHALPAGVAPETRSLSKLVIEGTITRFETEDGAVTLHLPAKRAGQAQVASYRVIPKMAGRLHTGASLLSAGGAETWVAPSLWTIR